MYGKVTVRHSSRWVFDFENYFLLTFKISRFIEGPLVDWVQHNPLTHSHHHNEFDVQNHEIDLTVGALLRDDILGDDDTLTCRVTFCRMVNKCPHNVERLQEQVAKTVDKVNYSNNSENSCY